MNIVVSCFSCRVVYFNLSVCLSVMLMMISEERRKASKSTGISNREGIELEKRGKYIINKKKTNVMNTYSFPRRNRWHCIAYTVADTMESTLCPVSEPVVDFFLDGSNRIVFPLFSLFETPFSILRYIWLLMLLLLCRFLFLILYVGGHTLHRYDTITFDISFLSYYCYYYYCCFLNKFT